MKIYTDGATSNNGYEGAQGGWAYILVNDHNQIVAQGSGSLPEATNNQCEMTALIQACKAADHYEDIFDIYSDSAYCVNCFKERWYIKWLRNGWVNSKKEPVANKELWEQLIPYFQDPCYNFHKVQGHADDYWNNYVDRMAVEAKGK